ncbi:major facilitator superfamily domain-containing protein [Gongronella butleri]|nr:major facilitator superfamily domain-containing protein [Gongronella butleri]
MADEEQSITTVNAADDKFVDVESPQFLTAEQMRSDPRNPKNWSNAKKAKNFFVLFWNAFVAFFTSSNYTPAILDVRAYFECDISVITATIALYIFVSGLAPLFWAPLSDRFGRKWTYVISMALFAVFSVICGLSKNVGMFFVFRLLQSAAASAPQAIGGGSVSDMYDFQSRGRMMSIFMLGVIFGPVVGPLVGGYVDQYLGWQWIFYVTAIFGGVLCIADILLLDETLYQPNHIKSYDEEKSTFGNWWDNFKFNPFTSLRLLARIDVLLACTPMAVEFGLFYVLVTTMQLLLAPEYGFTTGQVGLSYLAGGVGSQRFVLAPVAIALGVMGFLFYGWFLHAHFHWIAPLIGLAIVSVMMTMLNSMTVNYLIEGYLPQSSSMTAIANFTRCTLGMLFALVSTVMLDTMGTQWTFTLCALLGPVVAVATFPLLMKYGRHWRESRPIA